MSKIKYIHADVVNYSSETSYDVLISISAIEHIVPIEYDYHHDFDFYRDMLAINSMKKLVKKGGHILLTFPCGLERILCPSNEKIPEPLNHIFIPSRHHILIYNTLRIQKIISDWKIIKEKYWISHELDNIKGTYQASDKQTALNFEHTFKPYGAVGQTLCCLLLQKPS